MRKLTKASIDELQRQLPVLDEATQRLVFGGNSSGNGSDCVFYCMDWLYRNSMSGKHSSSPEVMESIYQTFIEQGSGERPPSGLGMEPRYLCGFMENVFQFDGLSSMDLYKNFNNYCGAMAIVSGGQHAVVITGIDTSDVDQNFIYWDPQKGVSGFLRFDEMKNILGMKDLAPKLK